MNRTTKIGVWITVAVVSLLANSSLCRAAVADSPDSPDSLVYSFYFRLSDAMLLADYRDNKQHFETLEQWMTPENIARISTVKIVGAASPEGASTFNDRLALRRAEAVKNYILWRWKISKKQPVIAIRQNDYLPAWILAVVQDPAVPRKDKVLQILNSNASLQTKWANIQLLAGGASQYIRKAIFPRLRNSVACIITLHKDAPTPVVPLAALPQNHTDANTATEPAKPAEPIEPAEPADDKKPLIAKPDKLLNPLFALKTNLLFNAASLLNVEVEVPIGKRWSVAGEWIFPWWLWEKQQHCLQLLSGNVEGKYWFGNREVMSNGKKRPLMTGWHAGLYAGGGYYDLEWSKVGYQGEFFIAAGISGGYAHTLNKSGSLRMEYSLGIGYMQTRYRKYDAEQDSNADWHLYRNSSGRYTWIGPTRARISFVWMIHSKKKGEPAR